MEGPIALDSSLSWTVFLKHISEGLQVTQDRLLVRTFTWKFQKPANSKAVSLHSNAGYFSMIRQILKKPDMPVIIVMMDAPLKQSQTVKSHVSSSSFTIVQYIDCII